MFTGWNVPRLYDPDDDGHGVDSRTLPKYCLTKSAFVTPQLFLRMLCDPPQRRDAVSISAPAGESDAATTTKSTNVVGGGLGFQLRANKSSPKVSFFILQRPTASVEHDDDDDEIKNSNRTTTHRIVLNPLFTHHKLRNKGKKYPNQFAILLPAELDRV